MNLCVRPEESCKCYFKNCQNCTGYHPDLCSEDIKIFWYQFPLTDAWLPIYRSSSDSFQIIDHSGNEFFSTISSHPVSTAARGYYFNGSDDGISVGPGNLDNNIYVTDVFSMYFWFIKHGAASGKEYIFSNQDKSTTEEYAGFYVDTNLKVRLDIDEGPTRY